jgi:hypothetical protein
MMKRFECGQIGSYKVHLHKQLMSTWMLETEMIIYSLEELWRICEECISCLSEMNRDFSDTEAWVSSASVRCLCGGF